MCNSQDTKPGCKEYRQVSRRRFLGLTAGTLAAAATPGWLPKVVFADSHNGSRDVLVSIFLRGGMDSLSVCVPFGEENYYRLRPNIAVPRPDSSLPGAALDLDGFFGLNPALSPLMEAYQNQDLLVVHAAGNLDPTRSHFQAMNSMEVGMPEPPGNLVTGWLGRHLASTAPTLEDAALRAINLGFGLPRTLVGGPKTLPVDDPANYGLVGDPQANALRQVELETLYSRHTEPLKTSAANNFRTIELLDQIDFPGYQPAGGASYGEDELGRALKSTAALIRADVGVEAVHIDVGGWDTHDFQGTLDGTLFTLLTYLSQGLAALHADLATSDRKVTTIAMSEFGRNVFENGSLGTDHGHGSMMIAMGGGIAGGRVLSQWPGLEDEQLYEGQDLAITTDYRDVLTEIVTRRLGNPDFRNVFPDTGYSPTLLGVTR